MILTNQRNSKKFLSIFLILSVFSANITLFSLPVLAYEKTDLFSKQIKSDSLNKSPNDNSPAENFLIEKNMNKKSDASKEYKKINNLKGLKQDKKDQQSYIAGEILVKYKNNKINLQTSKGRATALNFIRAKLLEKKEDLKKINTSVLKIKDGKTVEQKIAELKNDPNVEYAEPNYKRYPAVINTNDTYKDFLWSLDNTGQNINAVSGTNDADIDAPEVWAINEGTNASIIVAVIDTGVAYNHPDLLNNMWDGSNCKDENGILILGGCNHGYDYEDNDKIPLPTTSSHGTHIAGTIAAVKGNWLGVIGVAPQAKIMALKFLSANGGFISNEIKAIDFAIQNGAKIINASFGGPDFSQFEYDAINAFRNAGGIFIASAGNGGPDVIGDDNDLFPHYPSDFNLDNIISVAATDQNDALATFSNYGATSVDVGAPGTNIYSTINESNIFNEDFESVVPPSIGNKFTQDIDITWGTISSDDNIFITSDYANWGSYQNDIYSRLYSPTINLNGKLNSYLRFIIGCQTAPLYDSLGLWFYDGQVWDLIDVYSGEILEEKEYNLSDYANSNFRFRLTWLTDLSENSTGCLIDNIDVVYYSDGSDEQYGYMQGTSMATPHVVGLAALVWGYKPELSYAEVKNTILTTGDDLVSLTGKTVTGKRINAFNALNSLAPETRTISGTVKYYDGIKVIPNATVILENDIGAQIATTTTDINGFYQFTDVAGGGDYVVRASKSDNAAANGVDVLDLTKIRRSITEIEIFDQIFKKIAADVNNDLLTDVLDLVKIRRYITEIDILPSGAWKFYSSDAALTTENYLTLEPTMVYTNLIADMPNQDFIGIKMGDVNNSWINN